MSAVLVTVVVAGSVCEAVAVAVAVACAQPEWLLCLSAGVRAWSPRCRAVACDGCRRRCAMGRNQCWSLVVVTVAAVWTPTLLRVRMGCSLLCCDQDGSTALLWATRCGYLDVARWLVTDAGRDARSERDHVRRRFACVAAAVAFNCSLRVVSVATGLRSVVTRMATQPSCWHAVVSN